MSLTIGLISLDISEDKGMPAVKHDLAVRR